jgi:transposase InsO family protein
MTTLEELRPVAGVVRSCDALAVPRASYYRWRRPAAPRAAERPRPARALAPSEQDEVLALLDSPRFVDAAPREVYATLLDEGRYLCSPRTMYRLLAQRGEVRERRDQLRHPQYNKPELLATGPNQVWSWDITKLLGPQKWTYFYLYVLLDIFSRYVVGWLLAQRESATLAAHLLEESLKKEGVNASQVTVHSDRGGPMISKTVTQLLADLGVVQSLSRPHVSDDNPFSEAHFKTLKYHAGYPDRFGSIEDATAWSRGFFHWYNREHRHSGIGLVTPHALHRGQHHEILAARRVVLDAARDRHPDRFVLGRPRLPAVPAAAWINPPKPSAPTVLAAQ